MIYSLCPLVSSSEKQERREGLRTNQKSFICQGPNSGRPLRSPHPEAPLGLLDQPRRSRSLWSAPGALGSLEEAPPTVFSVAANHHHSLGYTLHYPGVRLARRAR